jgi:hypothetical protein
MRRAGRAVCLALLAGVLACSDSSSDSRSPSAEAQFDALWTDFDETYPYFTIKHVDWSAARATYRPRAASVTTERGLTTVLLELLGQLRDVHVNLVDPAGRWIPTWSRTYVPNYDLATWSAYAARWNVQTRGNWGHGWIGAVPYVYVDRWSQPLDGLDAAMEQFKDAPGLVLDVRMNPGGNSLYALPVIERLYDQPRIGGYVRYRNGPGHDDFTPFSAGWVSPGGAWQFTKPVLLLVGPASTSSTEGFTSALRELPHVTLAGDATGGATANPAIRPLAEGWSYTISQWFFITPDGIVVEGSGIPPHVAVAATPADFAAGVDPVLDYAEAWAAQPAILRGP